MIRVVCCDDHGIVASGLERVLSATDDLALEAAYTSGDALLAGVQLLRPDVALVDVDLPEESGLDLPAQIAQLSPSTRTIIFTMYSAYGYVRKARQNGAHGFLPKACPDDVIVQAVRDVAAGRSFVTIVEEPTAAAGSDRTLAQLSERELDVLRLLMLGLTNAEIATDLVVSPRTIENHRASIQRKLNVRTRAELSRAARAAGLHL